MEESGPSESTPQSPQTLMEVVNSVPLEELDQPCTETYLSDVALFLTEWTRLALAMGNINRVDINSIQEKCQNKLHWQNLELLCMWRDKLGHKATYRCLREALIKAGMISRQSNVDRPTRLSLDSSSSASSDGNALSSGGATSIGSHDRPPPLPPKPSPGRISPTPNRSTPSRYPRSTLPPPLPPKTPTTPAVACFSPSRHEIATLQGAIRSVLRDNRPASYHTSFTPEAVRWRNQVLDILRQLYHAQDEYLCLFASSLLPAGLALSTVHLTQCDSQYIGFFLRCLCRNATEGFRFVVGLNQCMLGNLHIELMMKELGKCSYPIKRTSRRSPAEGYLDLHLQYNAIDVNGVRFICAFIQCNPQVIRQLELGYNKIVQYGLFPSCLLSVLDGNAFLTHLDLTSCQLKLSRENGPQLVDALQRNTTLKVLSLHYNRDIGCTGLRYIVQGVTGNKGIRELYLSWCGIGENGDELLANMLSGNRMLACLDVCGNEGLGRSGFEKIGACLKKNATLQSLMVNQCCYTLSAMNQFVCSLKGNSSLSKLVVDSMEDASSLARGVAEVNVQRQQRRQPQLVLHSLQ